MKIVQSVIIFSLSFVFGSFILIIFSIALDSVSKLTSNSNIIDFFINTNNNIFGGFGMTSIIIFFSLGMVYNLAFKK